MLTLKHLKFAHPDQSSPYDFNLSALPGQITTITGPSGIGKSTLLDLIAGFLAPISGIIALNQTDLIPLSPQKRPISILFQTDNLFDHLDVKTNLKLGLDSNQTNTNLAISDALEAVGLASFINQKAKNLSGGQQQRVALARTLLRKKPIMLLDEPFANLDQETAQNMRHLVKTLTKQNNWHTILVSHLANDTKGYADNIYQLD